MISPQPNLTLADSPEAQRLAPQTRQAIAEFETELAADLEQLERVQRDRERWEHEHPLLARLMRAVALP